ncbi:BZ3500_MvSof-1268-A1-R1_Chr6-2g08528 [Microbotryum saponariae]|uniref:BZ3500_MvSof-1268-A1-R1_Chr6-2g08528 protein n=1 Tax=Microbotryum saponariae TaxID=289078 RepID=A0A2X0MEV6_9BASI|nr:BZ3500_MvSof-1268-A1-R1_Chr6-2g08528 [Microbotryum saponariae]SDA07805.1 BZ3501_MvSof-1269-A2-R1_Chr6-1g08242 [Microbotryum saponariae]
MNSSRYADDDDDERAERYGGEELHSEAGSRTDRGSRAGHEREGDQPDDDEDDEAGFDPGLSARSRKYLALKPPIASLCTALGGVEEFKDDDGEIFSAYSLGDQVVGCLKDLKRFWRMDEKDDDRTVARIFYDVGLLKNDLVPILLATLESGAKGERIGLACIELIGAMTWPIDVVAELQEAKTHDELKKSQDYTSLIDAQLTYKSIILRNDVLRVMLRLMTPSLSKTHRNRTAKDESVISLILYTFRNLVAMVDRPPRSESSEAIERAQLQSSLIVQMYEEGIFDLLVAIAHSSTSSEYAPWNMVVLDILHLAFRCARPNELMIASDKITENRLKDLLDFEGREKKAAARLGNTRHSRFGTTVALKSASSRQRDGHQYIMHKQSSLSRGAEQTLDQIKKSKAKKYRADDDLAPPSSLQPPAIKVLRRVALAFIDSAFNPFFSSVLKDIRMERMKVKESDTIRFLFLSRFFLEFFLLVHADEQARGIDPSSEEGHDFGLIAEMTETQSIAFVTQRMKVALEEKPPLWMDLHAGIECFTQILLVIEALAASGIPDHIDVAEILQNKIYYEAETLDMVVTVVTKYNTQSHKYLDSVINLAYVLLRMLERYAKSKAYMYVRKKKARQSRRKKGKKKDGDDEEDEFGLGGNEEEDEVDRSKFADEGVLQTCMTYLESYKFFKTPEQLKRIVSLMHRQAVKSKSEGLFYKPSVLDLFKRILDDEHVRIARDQATTDLKKLIEFILKKFFKAVKEKPMLLLECFFPKTRSQLHKMRMGEVDPYASSDDEAGPGCRIKIPSEVEVTPGFSLTQQIGIAVACLVDAGDLPLVEFVLSQLALASAARTEIVLTTDGASAALLDVELAAEGGEKEPDSDEAIRRKAAMLKGPSQVAMDKFMPHQLVFEEGTRQKEEVTGNATLRLLMGLLNWENDDSTELIWSIPSSLIPATLDGDVQTIENFLLDPVDPHGKTAADYLRKKRKPAKRRTRREDTPEYDEEGNLIEVVKKITKRVKKGREDMVAYKSAQFIEDSDDDELEDQRFFAREAAVSLIHLLADGGTLSGMLIFSFDWFQLRAKLAAGEIESASTTGGTKAKAKTVPKKLQKDKSERVSRRPKKNKEFAPIREVDVSDESDLDEERLEVLRREARKEKGKTRSSSSSSSSSSEQEDADDEDVRMNDVGTASSGTGTYVTGKARSTSASSVGPLPKNGDHLSSEKREMSDSEDEGEVANAKAAGAAVKRRKVVIDSDEDDE